MYTLHDDQALLTRDHLLAEPAPEGVRHRVVSVTARPPLPRPAPSPEALRHLMASLSRKRPLK
ncbi:MAG: hypothetical protein AMXMBFR33_46370 [Candidatus Xenobia bacterium]